MHDRVHTLKPRLVYAHNIIDGSGTGLFASDPERALAYQKENTVFPPNASRPQGLSKDQTSRQVKCAVARDASLRTMCRIARMPRVGTSAMKVVKVPSESWMYRFSS